jgi:3'-5' exoribonuclease
MKDIYISDVAAFDEGRSFDSYFLVLAKQQRLTKTNKPYLNLMLGDRTGQIEGRIWDPNDPRIAKDFEKGDIVKVRGSASRFDDRVQMKIDQLRLALPGQTEKADLMPATIYDVDALWNKLTATIDSFTNADLKRLLQLMLEEPAMRAAYREAPAARQLHHAWLGGLLEHVVSLLEVADGLAAHYPLLDRDLLLTGVILHDIGKTRELSWVVGFDYTVEGILLGHIQFGVEMVAKAIEKLPGFPERLKTLVIHMILAHHGKLEFGSPKLPMIPEALVLNFVDDLDAKMIAMQTEYDKCEREGKSGEEMTGKVWSLDNRQLLNTRKWLAGEKS